jgi:hypothetical protein
MINACCSAYGSVGRVMVVIFLFAAAVGAGYSNGLLRVCDCSIYGTYLFGSNTVVRYMYSNFENIRLGVAQWQQLVHCGALHVSKLPMGNGWLGVM